MNVSASGFCSAELSDTELTQSCQDVLQTLVLWVYRGRGCDVLQSTELRDRVTPLKWTAGKLFTRKQSSDFIFTMFHVLLLHLQQKSHTGSVKPQNASCHTYFYYMAPRPLPPPGSSKYLKQRRRSSVEPSRHEVFKTQRCHIVY